MEKMLSSIRFRAVRAVRTFLLLALVRIPLDGLATGLTLYLTARLAGSALQDAGVTTIGTTTLTAFLTAVGVVIGCLAGFAVACQGALRAVEEDVREWLMQLPSDDNERRYPRVEVRRLRSGYEETMRSICEPAIGRIPCPGFVRRAIQAQFRPALLEEFLEECEQRGATTVGFAEVRDALLLKALPLLTRPAHMQLTIGNRLLAGLLVGSVALPLIVAMVAHSG
jgi:hypothetical protein